MSGARVEIAAARTRSTLNASQRALAIGLVLSVTLVAFESTAVITALPTITDELHGIALYGITIAAYMLADLIALVWASQQADRRGVRLPFLICIGVFLTGLLVAATAQAMIVVVIGRFLQGAGSGGFAPLAYISVRRAFPEDRQPTMYAFLSAGWVLPSLIAPALSGVVVDSFGWRWVFIGIAPFAATVALLTARAMAPLATPDPAAQNTERRPSRLPRAVQAATGVALVAFGVQGSNLVVAVVLGLAGVAVGAPALRMLLPVGTFRARRGLPAIMSVRFLVTATFLGVDSFIPLAADRLHGARPIAQGFVIAGSAVFWSAGQALAARRAGRYATRRFATFGFGCLLLAISTVWPVLFSGWPLAFTFVSWCIGGLGIGTLFNPTTVAAMTYATEGREGEVSGQLHLADSLGFGIMSVVGGAFVALSDHTSLTLQGALTINFGLAASCAIVGLLAARNVTSNDG
jgi:MFS family permease